jgi:hypothetical protein
MLMHDPLTHVYYFLNGRERIEASYRKAVALGASDPAVLLLDLRDLSARSIVETVRSAEEIAAIVIQAEAIGADPLASWGMPRELVVAHLRVEFPQVAETIEAGGGGEGYWAAIVAVGSATAVAMPPIVRPA